MEELKNQIVQKYSTHEDYADRFDGLVFEDVEEMTFYEWKKIGYELIETFKDEKLSRLAFEKSLELAEDDEDYEDIVDDISFLDEDWANELKELYGIEDDE